MAKKKKKTTGFGKLFLLGVIAVVAVAAGGYYAISKIHPELTPPKQKPIVTVTPRPTPIAPERSVSIYLPKQDKKGFHLGPVAGTTREKGDILDVALKSLLATNKGKGIAAGLIPKGTKLLSPVRTDNGIATANLSREFTDNFSGGSDQEAITINSIILTLVSNSGGKVNSVRILVEGKTVDTLGGHFDLTEPVKADNSLLRPGSVE